MGRWKRTFGHKPLETIAEAQRKARRYLPWPVYVSLLAGVDRGTSLRDNIDAFASIGFRTRIGKKLPLKRDMRTRVMDQDIDLPVIISPAGVQAVRPNGEVPVARAAKAMGTAIGQSNFGSSEFADVAAANPKAFAQLYWIGKRDQIAYRVDRVRRAGAKGIILTLDAWTYAAKDWGSPSVPAKVNLPEMIKHIPMGLSRPKWLMNFLTHEGIPDLRIPNFEAPGRSAPTWGEAFADWEATPFPSWEDVRWLAELWGGPFMVKGILTPEDAQAAVDAGATAISVSNHGGNNLDGAPSGLRALPAIARLVGDRTEVLYDGGIRRGSDVVAALALGAKAVMIGRAWLFGLAADGERGVREVLEVIRGGIDNTLVSLGHASIHDVSRDDLFLPEDFELYPSDSWPAFPERRRGRTNLERPPTMH